MSITWWLVLKDVCLSLLKELLNIYSPSGEESKAVEFLVDRVNDLGLRSYIDQYGNYIASFGEGDLTIALVSHIDTVPGYIEVSLDNDRIYGRGAVDAKGPLVAMICGALESMRFVPDDKVKVVVVGCVREESDSYGARGLISSGFKSDLAIIGEPTGSDRIAISYRGSLKIKVKCISDGGHSSSYWMYSYGSACDRLIDLWYSLRYGIDSRDINGVSCSLTKMQCGESFNTIPISGEAVFDIRYPPDILYSDILKRIDMYLPKGCVIDSILSTTPPVKVNPGNLAARLLARAIVRNGMKPTYVAKAGTSDMNILAYRITNNIVAYGPGDPLRSHTAHEFIRISEFLQGINIYRDFIIEASKYSSHRSH